MASIHSRLGNISSFFYLRIVLYAILDGIGYGVLRTMDAKYFVWLYGYFVFVFIVSVWYERTQTKSRFWLEMPVGNTVFTAMAFLLPTLWIYYTPELRFITDWNTSYVALAILIGIVGLHATWIGYRLGKIIIPKFPEIVRIPNISIGKTWILLGIYAIGVLLAILSGTYGITESHDYAATTKFTQYIFLAQQFGYIGLGLYILNQKRSRWIRTLLLFICLFGIGLLSGRKSFALQFAVIVGLAVYYRYGKVPRYFYLAFVAMTVVAFSIVTDFRTYYFKQGNESISSVSDLLQSYSSAMSSDRYDAYETPIDQANHMLSRFYYCGSITKVLMYVEKTQEQIPSDYSPWHMFGAPFYAFMPRIIWKSKPVADFGRWITWKVKGGGPNPKYSIGITQSAYAYLFGGLRTVVLLMFCIGMFQALLYQITAKYMFPIYLMLFVINLFPADVLWAYISGAVQVLVVGGFICWVLSVNWQVPYIANRIQNRGIAG